MENQILAETKVLQIIAAETADKTVYEINLTDRFDKDLQMDSLDVITVCANIESDLHVIISDREIAGLKTVGDLIKLVEERLSEK